MLHKLTIVFLALMLALSACGPVMTPSPATSITDGLGREVTLTGPAQKVVSLAPSNTEILFAIGAGAQTIGRDDFSDYPAEAKSLPSVGGSMGNYSTEQIAALKPDLVLAAEINTPEQVKAISDLGITVYYLSNPKTLEEMYTNLEIAAKLTGHESDAAVLIESLKQRVAAVDEKIMPLSARPTVFYEIDGTDPAKPYSAGPGTFVDLLIERAGGANLVGLAGITDAYPLVSLEQIVSANPSIIILGDAAWGVTPESVGQRSGWDKIAAVQNNQIYAFDDNLASRPGPRLVDGLEAMAKILHPGVFQ